MFNVQDCDRRLRYFRMSDRGVLSILRISSNWPDVIQFPELDGPPEDAVIQAVEWQFEYRCFYVLCEHPTFDVVKRGERIPIDDDEVGTKMHALSRQEDGSYREVEQ